MRTNWLCACVTLAAFPAWADGQEWRLHQAADGASQERAVAARDFVMGGHVLNVSLRCGTEAVRFDFTVATGAGFEIRRFYGELTAKVRYWIDDEPSVQILRPQNINRLSLDFGATDVPLAVIAHAKVMRFKLPYPSAKDPVVTVDFTDPTLATFRQRCGKFVVFGQ